MTISPEIRFDALGVIGKGKAIQLMEEFVTETIIRKAKVNVPEGYETEADTTGECYACDFSKITGKGEHEELHCVHPTPANTGCVDAGIIFLRIA